jgi:hypothetical protein
VRRRTHRPETHWRARLALGIRILLVVGATSVVVIPLARRIDPGWMPVWVGLVALLVFVVVAVLWRREDQAKTRWWIPVGVIAVAFIAFALFAIIIDRESKRLDLVVVGLEVLTE